MTAILILDDRAENRDLFATVLGFAKFTVLQASTGEAALALAQAEHPDLIIADILMPGMDGYEFVRALRDDAVTAAMPVILCTATYGEDEVRRVALACGVSHVLIKPCEPEEVLRVVDEALGATGEFDPSATIERLEREHRYATNVKLVEKITELEKLNQEHTRLEHELRQAEQRTAQSLTLLETLQSTAPVGFVFVDREFRIQRINQMLAAANGSPAEDQIGRLVADVVPDIWPQLEPIYRHVLEAGVAMLNQEVHRELPDAPGHVQTLLTSYYPVRLHEEIIGVGVVAVDITDRREAEEFRRAVMDNMVEGLYVLDSEGRLTYMNAAATRMLGYCEEELRGKPMHEAVHYQRADGSAFPAEECELLKVRAEGRPVRKAEDAFTRKDGTILPTAYSAAPLGAGVTGHGVVVVFRDTTQEQGEQTRAQRELNALTWVGRIRDALDEERLVLYSQPIVPLGDGEPSEELLVRMLGRDGEVIPPGSFLPVAEKYGLIGEVDRLVIAQAVHLAAAGRHVHANLSADSIGHLDLLPLIERELRGTAPGSGGLVFEITETALMGDVEAGEAFARGLTDIGCALALDDFGTGFGSFTYLKRFPIKYLKIDIDFVRDMPSNEANQHLVKAIVNLAKAFGYDTIAEGVEDAETLELLRSYGVDFAQGFYVGPPAPINQA